MIGDLSVVALIPARGGSKGISGKNIKMMAGRPMIDYTIRAGLESRYVDDVVVSTDDEEIAQVARSCGASVPFMRPAELASDTSKAVDAVVHARDELLAADKHYDVLVLLQATSPLRTAEDVDAALEMFVQKDRASLVAVTPVTEHPVHMCTIDDDGMRHALLPGVNGTVRRQDMPPVYRVNGAIYINNADEITLDTSFNDNEVGFIMSAEHSVDVDDLDDFARAERILEARNGRSQS